MRIAILLAGQTRTWRRCALSHISLFPEHDVDFYLQAWVPAPRSELLASYLPCAIKIEIPKPISETVTARMMSVTAKICGPKNHSRARSMLYQWRAIQNAWTLLKDRSYDVVVRLRYDLLFQGSLSERLDSIEEDICIVPRWRDTQNGFNDHFAIMGARAADAYCNGMIDFLMDRLNASRDTHPFHFTRNLEEHLVENHVTVIECPMPYLLVRPEDARFLKYNEMARHIEERNEGATFKSVIRRNRK